MDPITHRHINNSRTHIRCTWRVIIKIMAIVWNWLHWLLFHSVRFVCYMLRFFRYFGSLKSVAISTNFICFYSNRTSNSNFNSGTSKHMRNSVRTLKCSINSELDTRIFSFYESWDDFGLLIQRDPYTKKGERFCLSLSLTLTANACRHYCFCSWHFNMFDWNWTFFFSVGWSNNKAK